MTKKTMSYNEDNQKETFLINNTSTDNSENSTNNNKPPINKAKIEYEYYTPMKKIKKIIPTTPKKKKSSHEKRDLPIVGKNLLSIFESM